MKPEPSSKQDNMNNPTSSNFIEEQISKFKNDNPQVEETLRLFNVSREHYEVSIAASQQTKTFVTTSTLLPTKHG